MAITLKEAIEKSPSAIEENKMKEELLKEVFYLECINELDRLIKINLPEILIKPISIYFSIPCNYEEKQDLIKMYKDFTIDFSNWEQAVSIKLADKDWDWSGYDVKEVKEESPLGRFAEEHLNRVREMNLKAFPNEDGDGYTVRNTMRDFDAVNSPSPLSKAKQMVRDWFSCK